MRPTSFFSRDGCFVTPDSTIVHGRAEIRSLLQQLVALLADLTIDQRTMLVAGGVALGSESWTMRIGAGGVRRSTRSTLVMGRVENRWRIVISDPWANRSVHG